MRQPRFSASTLAVAVIGCAWHATHPPSRNMRPLEVSSSGWMLRLQAVSTAAYYPQEVRHDCMPSNITSVWLLTSTKLTVLPHRSLPEPKMLDHDLGKPETTSSHHSGSLTSL